MQEKKLREEIMVENFPHISLSTKQDSTKINKTGNPQCRTVETNPAGIHEGPAYTTATATQDPSRICNPHHVPQQCRILNALSEARDRTRVLMDASRVRFH